MSWRSAGAVGALERRTSARGVQIMSETDQREREPRAYLVRAGRSGERDDFALEEGVAGGGFADIGDLSGIGSGDELSEAVRNAWPGDPEGKVTTFTGQLWSLIHRIQPGDLVVLPLKTTSQVAIGRCSGPYKYLAGEPTPEASQVAPHRHPPDCHPAGSPALSRCVHDGVSDREERRCLPVGASRGDRQRSRCADGARG